MDTQSISNELSQNKILIIEDDFYIQDIYKNYLEEAGFDVTVSVDGQQGLKQATAIKPAVILLDIMLPVMNGVTVLKMLKEDSVTSKIPVVLITNLGQRDVIVDAFNHGAQGFLLKVRCDQDTLLNTVREYIKNPKFKMDLNSESID
jgi:DNA-binding response OmpR family regulator